MMTARLVTAGVLMLVTLSVDGACQVGGAVDAPRELLAGVKSIAGPGAPGGVIAFGPQSFAIVVGGKGPFDAVVAGAKWGQGRVIIFGHTGYLDPNNWRSGDTGRFLQQAARWAGGKEKPRVLVAGNEPLVKRLQQDGFQVSAGRIVAGQLANVDLVIGYERDLAQPEAVTAAAQFVQAGGGLILASTGWGWLQLNPGKTLTADHPGNRLLRSVGLAWTGQIVSKNTAAGFKTEVPPGIYLNADAALTAFEQKSKLTSDEQRQALHTLAAALSALPAQDELLLARLRRLRDRHAEPIIPTAKKPIRSGDGLRRLFAAWDVQQMNTLPTEKLTAHPAAEVFPGPVPAAARPVNKTVTVDTRIPGWHSTGLYAIPGRPIQIELSAAAAEQGLSLRIGCHADANWHHDAWRRLPEICRVWPLKQTLTPVASSMGGLVYVVVPDRSTRPGPLQVRIEGAVEAPLFVLDETDEQEWISRISKLPGPWAELGTKKLIITVPSRVIRELRNPAELMRAWDRVMDASAELKRMPKQRSRPERFVLDEQISAGYMHSGYPLMAHLDVEKTIVDAGKVARGEGMWGFFHEIGHNHQEPEWTFDGTGEVTVNLFTMFVHEKVCGRQDMGTELSQPEKLREKVRSYFAKGAPFAEWKSDPFLALCMYIQLQQEFGWVAYQDVFEEYRKLPRAERPRNDDEKRDQWLVRFSVRVGKNLGPFFEAWGVPTSPAARAKIAHLPTWMPKDFPPKPRQQP